MATKATDRESRGLKVQKTKLERWLKKNADKILCHQSLPYVLEIIRTKLIKRYYSNLLASYFKIDKI